MAKYFLRKDTDTEVFTIVLLGEIAYTEKIAFWMQSRPNDLSLSQDKEHNSKKGQPYNLEVEKKIELITLYIML